MVKNGAAMLEDCSFAAGSVADAIKLLEKAKEAAAKGYFDDMSKATARAARQMQVQLQPEELKAVAYKATSALFT
jgi:hypothetical protein